MYYQTTYESMLGTIMLISQDNALIGLMFKGQKYAYNMVKNQELIKKDDLEIFIETKQFLDDYFKGEQVKIANLKLSLIGTDFQKQVWDYLIQIPYGQVITYNDIAKKIAQKRGIKKMSAQAVGGAVGHNPLSIIIPCHRVIGSNGSLTGYAGGIDKKIKLLEIEGIDTSKYVIPKNSNATSVAYFKYGKKEINYLCKQDKKLKAVIEKEGHIYRQIDNTDLFTSLVHHIIAQQISTTAQKTIWLRMKEKYPDINPKVLANQSANELQSIGLTYRKVDYIQSLANSVINHEVDLDELDQKEDKEVIKILSSLKGIGIWTAEMILLFNLQRPNVFSYGDLAIIRGLKKVYHHSDISKELFEKYRKRFSPYCSVASIYLWAVAKNY